MFFTNIVLMKKGDDNMNVKLLAHIAKFVLITMIVFGFLPGDQKAYSTTPIVDSKYSSDTEGTSLTKLTAEDSWGDINIRTAIYLVTTEDVASISEGKELPVAKNSFVYYNESTNQTLSGAIVKNGTKLAKVPDEIAKGDNFFLRFKLKEGVWGKAYKTLPSHLLLNPAKKSLTNTLDNSSDDSLTTLLLYGTQATRDLTIYHGRFIRFIQNGESFYIPIDTLDISIQALRDLRLSSKVLTNGKRTAFVKPYEISTNITTASNATASEIDKQLEGTALHGLGQAFVDMEEKYGVNALFGVAVAITETGWGESYLARTRNNLFGIAAYDGNEGAAYSFATKEQAIDHWGDMIKDVYFNRGYRDLVSVNSIYASNQGWSSDVAHHMSNIKAGIIRNR